MKPQVLARTGSTGDPSSSTDQLDKRPGQGAKKGSGGSAEDAPKTKKIGQGQEKEQVQE